MTSSQALGHALTLFSGELLDSAGRVLMSAADPVVVVRSRDEARGRLADGRRVAIAVPLAANGVLTRLSNVCAARLRLASARRSLAAAGAGTVRAFAIVTAGDALFLVYEFGETIQPYVENYIVFEPASSAPARAAKRVLRTLSGLPAGVDLVVVIGAPA